MVPQRHLDKKSSTQNINSTQPKQIINVKLQKWLKVLKQNLYPYKSEIQLPTSAWFPPSTKFSLEIVHSFKAILNRRW